MWRRALTLLLLLLIASNAPTRLAARPADEALCFSDVPGIVDCLEGTLREYWERNGGLPVFGYPLGPALPEITHEGLFVAQHFERNRLELHPQNPPPYHVLLGRSGAERLAQLGRSSSPAPPAQPQPGCHYFTETGHNVCHAFLDYWRSHGLDMGDSGVSFRESLALFGYPLAEAAVETNANGDTVLTQWFERARFEYHPHNPEPYKVLLGLLDKEVRAAQTPAAPAPGWVEVAGSQLVQQGQPIKLKGINYYPSEHPWGFMWTEWDGPTIAQELARARRELEINTVRVLVPYRSKESWTDDRGRVNPNMVERLRQFIQIAGANQLKVIVTLFDWYDPDAWRSGRELDYNRSYLQAIVGALKDDDRVLAWDIHNEPDNYPSWKAGHRTSFVDWLVLMADAIRALDQRHLLTVGVGHPDALWVPSSGGRTIADISDFISVHSYDAARYQSLVSEVRARTSKPILLEEFGWPTGPYCRGPWYDEESQLYLYRQALEAAQQSDLAGMLSWWFKDPPLTTQYAVDENGHFGLYRHDEQPKPAVGPFRAYRVPPLPSNTSSNYQLTVAPPPEAIPRYDPLFFEGGIVLRGEFRAFWEFFGGEAVFGKPLTHAYLNAQDTIVQYFERARLELNDETLLRIDPRNPALERPEVYLERVHLTPLGQQALGGRSFARVANPGRPDVRYFEETGHTLSGAFLDLWETRGAAFFGLPLSEPLAEVIDGTELRVQYFTYWRFEQLGDGSVRLAALGRQALAGRQCPDMRR